MEEGHVVRAVYNFQTDLEGELSLQVGDVILITRKIDKQWLQGISAGREGNFPSGFVLAIKLPCIAPNQKLFAATDNFVAQEDGDLSFIRGDIIVGRRPIDDNWWTGDCNSKQGIFPLTHVWELDIKRIKIEEGPKKVNLKAKVKMDVKAQLPKEVDLRKGEIVTVTELTDKDWYTGISGGQIGMFPAAFVTLINEPATEITVPSIDVSQEISQTDFPSVKVNELETSSGDSISFDSDNQFGYDNTNSGITPYGRTRSSFIAQYPNELTFGRGEIITLIRHIDDEWMEGEIDGKIGLFPLNYIDVIVDCGESNKTKQQSNNNQLQSDKEYTFPNETYGKVLYDYKAQVDGDLTLKEGDIVTLLRSLNSNWLEAMTNDGNIGLCPANFISIVNSNSFSLSQSTILSPCSNLHLSSTYGTDWADFAKGLNKPERPPPPYSSVVSTTWSQENSFHSRRLSAPDSLDDSIAFNIQKLDLNLSTVQTQARTLPQNTYSDSHSNIINYSKTRSYSMAAADKVPKQDRSSSDLLSYEEALHQSRPLAHTTSYNIAQGQSYSYMGENNTYVEGSEDSPIPKTSTDLNSHNIVREDSLSQRIPHRPAPTLPVSRRSSSSSSVKEQEESTEHRNVTNIQQQLSEKRGQLQKLERCKKKLLQEKGYDINKNGSISSTFTELGNEISSCDAEMSRLQSEIKELEESIQRTTSHTYEEEDKFKQEDVIEKKRKEELERREIERRKKMNELRQCVIAELLQTERDYLIGLQICHTTFLSDPEKGKAKGIEMGMLFGNLDEVIDMASRLLKRLEETKQESDPDNQLIGDCFLDLADDLKEVYGHYCRNHDDIHTLLDKYEKNPISAQYLNDGVSVMRQQTNCFDLRSVLIKPVQRILKYPLLLNELVKCTEDTHLDKKKLISAVGLMTDVATQINEFKRKKDLVFKYRKDADTSLSTRISKLNLHSVMKKSSRFGVKFSSTIGLKTMTRDEAFETAEHEFRNLAKTVKIFLKDVNTFIEHMQEYAMTALNVAEDIADFYQERKTQSEVDQLRTAHHTVVTQFWEEFKLSTERYVIDPLNQLLQMFHGPHNLIQKRNDKLLDYEACTSRLERNKDVTKQKSLQDDQQLSKNTYEALNSQLIDDLPKLSKLSTEILNDCIIAFLQARKKFLGHTAKQMIDLMELPLLMGNKSNFLETFQIKHNIAVARLLDFSSTIRHLFLSNSSAVKSETVGKKTSPSSHRLNLGSSESNTQTASQQAYLKSKYPAISLYDVLHTYKAIDILDISVQKGDIVRVIKKQDPMGSPHRWFVDTGNVQGFVPAKFLKSISVNDTDTLDIATNRRYSMPSSNKTLLSQCTKLDNDIINVETTEKRNSEPILKQTESQEVSSKNEQYENLMDISSNEQYYSNIPFNEFDPFAPLNYNSEATSEDLYTTHRYETIPEDDPLTMLQPDSSNLGSQITINYYYAAYPFTARGDHQLSVAKGQVVLVHHKSDLHGNSDWWFVEDRHGNQGYVPGNYLVKYTGS